MTRSDRLKEERDRVAKASAAINPGAGAYARIIQTEAWLVEFQLANGKVGSALCRSLPEAQGYLKTIGLDNYKIIKG